MTVYPTPFFDWDESIYAQVGREMIQNQSFFVPLWQGLPWLDKPPIPSLFYGIVQLLPVAPEVSTRIATLLLSCTVLFFLYALSYKVTKDSLVSLLTVIITSFLPIYFQRTIALNVDVFLLLGWMGYVFFFKNWKLSTFFLLIAVLSKSLLGFFPLGMFLMYYTFEYFRKTIMKKELFKIYQHVFIQVGVATIWFISMYAVYKYPFIQYQIIDSHFKRVTSSIEQHFGHKTFYLTVLIDQLKVLLIPASFSCLYLLVKILKKKTNALIHFLGLIFVPWFLFLNLTKTKIEWYTYPVLPQFTLLAVYPVTFIKNKVLKIVFIVSILLIFFLKITPTKALLTQPFSKLEDHQRIAIDAKKNGCTSIQVLVNDETRSSYKTLKSMNLVISTTTWWGNHPSIAYYSSAKTEFIYDEFEAIRKYKMLKPSSCMVMEKKDAVLFPKKKYIPIIPTANKTYFLYKAI